jgi:hypothetical protein
MEIPSETEVHRYAYSEEASCTGKARTSSVRLGVLGGKRFDDLSLNEGQKLLLKFWMFSKPSVSTVEKMEEIPKHGGYFSDTVKNRIANTLKMDGIREWEFFKNWEELPDIEANWIVDPPYQNQKSFNKCYGNFNEIDYKKLGEWTRSRKGLVIAHDLEGADWLPFKPFREQKIPTITGKAKVKVSKEAIYIQESQ